MIAKILRIQLFTLFLITLIVCFTYYYLDVLPDNYFTISSASKSFSYIGYYLISFAAYIEYFTGSWILISFITFAVTYAFVLSKRAYRLDTLVPLSISLLSLTLFACYIPEYLGRGLNYLVMENIPNSVMLLFFFGLIIANLCLIFRQAFYQFVVKCIKFLFSFRKERTVSISNASSSAYLEKSKTKRYLERVRALFKFKLKLNVTRALRGSYEKEETIREIKNVANVSTEANAITAKEEALPTEEVTPLLSSEIVQKANKVNEKKYYQIVKTINSPKDKSRNIGPDEKYFEEIICRIEDKLNEFRIDGQIINVLKGPVVDTFELELGAGVKVSKVTSSSEDLSMALYGAPIRIVYPMRGKTTVGIEVPRNPREIIYLDEILTSKDFQKAKQDLPLAMGKDAFGEPFIVDLASMPHMLVAGSTGSGKSVFINSLLVSLLIKRSPEQMKLILIDPKQLELSLYSELPHLLLPVVTEAKIASLALAWAVKEMDRRYSIMKEFQVRNLKGFNEKLKSATPEMLQKIAGHYDTSDGSAVFELPNLVIIVDEFADLILTRAGKEIEHNICRLAGKARAAGIHMVIATQRPSVDVITGLIKSNFPTRVSFRVTTSVDSRTILNAMGAEKLLGKGDMLYKSGVETIRVHSSFVDEDEIEALTSKLSEIKPEFNKDAVEFIENGGEDSSASDPYAYGSHINTRESSGEDALFDQAVSVVMEYRAASASMLQRRLKIGYNRAANLIEQMEEKGIVGPAQGSKPRKVLGGPEQSV